MGRTPTTAARIARVLREELDMRVEFVGTYVPSYDDWLRRHVATRAVAAWMRPRHPIAAAPPEITAKEALHATRRAIADGVSADETPVLAT